MIREVHSQYIHVRVDDKCSDFCCELTITYAKNTIEERKDLWHEWELTLLIHGVYVGILLPRYLTQIELGANRLQTLKLGTSNMCWIP